MRLIPVSVLVTSCLLCAVGVTEGQEQARNAESKRKITNVSITNCPWPKSVLPQVVETVSTQFPGTEIEILAQTDSDKHIIVTLMITGDNSEPTTVKVVHEIEEVLQQMAETTLRQPLTQQIENATTRHMVLKQLAETQWANVEHLENAFAKANLSPGTRTQLSELISRESFQLQVQVAGLKANQELIAKSLTNSWEYMRLKEEANTHRFIAKESKDYNSDVIKKFEEFPKPPIPIESFEQISVLSNKLMDIELDLASAQARLKTVQRHQENMPRYAEYEASLRHLERATNAEHLAGEEVAKLQSQLDAFQLPKISILTLDVEK